MPLLYDADLHSISEWAGLDFTLLVSLIVGLFHLPYAACTTAT